MMWVPRLVLIFSFCFLFVSPFSLSSFSLPFSSPTRSTTLSTTKTQERKTTSSKTILPQERKTKTQWTCTFTDEVAGYVYDLTPDNSNKSADDGLWQTTDGTNFFFFKLCDPTTTTPLSTCPANTQVCQRVNTGDGAPFDASCGLGPPIPRTFDGGSGVALFTDRGASQNCRQGRSTLLNAKCLHLFPDKQNGEVGPPRQSPPCNYNIDIYLSSACGVIPSEEPDESLSIGWIIVIVFFSLVLVYLIGGVGFNLSRGKREFQEVFPNFEFWKDLPFLVGDGIRFTFDRCRALVGDND